MDRLCNKLLALAIASILFNAFIHADTTQDLQTQLKQLGYNATVKMVNNVPVAQGGPTSFKPFDKNHLSILNIVKVDNPKVTFEKAGASFNATIEGDYTLFDFGTQKNPNFLVLKKHGKLRLQKIPDGRNIKVLAIDIPTNWKLSDTFPNVKGSAFEAFTLYNTTLFFSEDNYRDKDLSLDVKTGLNFKGNTKPAGPIQPFTQLLNFSSDAQLSVIGYIPENPLESVIRFQLSKALSFKTSMIEVGEIALEIGGTAKVPGVSIIDSILSSMSIVGEIIVKPSPKDDPLIFVMRLILPGIQSIVTNKGNVAKMPFTLSATMEGKWKKPFGIPGIEIGSDHSECIKNNIDSCPDVPKGVAVQATLTPENFAKTGLPDTFGVAGALTLGKRHVAMAVQLPMQPPSGIKEAGKVLGTVLYGELDEYTLSDVVQSYISMATAGASAMAGGIPLDKLPLDAVGMKKIKVYVVPTATKIGEISFHEGITLRGDVFAPGFEAYGALNVNYSGISLNAFCSEINFGPLHVTKSGQETASDQKERDDMFNQLKKEGIFDDAQIKKFQNGPLMHLAISKEKQELLISGKISIASMFEEETYISINKSGLTFDLKASFGKAVFHGKSLIEAHLNATAKFEKPINFHVVAEFQSNLQQYILEEVKNGLEKAKDEITKGISEAKQAVGEKMGSAEHSISGASSSATSAISGASEKASGAIQSAQEKVDSLQKDVDRLKESVKRHEKGCLL